MKNLTLHGTDNPLVTSLGPMLSNAVFARKLATEESGIAKLRKHPSHLRIIYGEQLFEDVVVPSHIYYSVYTSMLSAMLRRYSHVSWQDPEFVRRAYGIGNFPPIAVDTNLVKPSSSIVVVGPSGAGKTTMINSISKLWKPHVTHDDIAPGQKVVQIPMLYVPLTGRVTERGLYFRIIQAIDSRIGGHVLIQRHNYRRLSEPDLRSAAHTLCVQFNVGLIAIDEAQCLSGATSKTPNNAINELLYLRDGLGIPLVFCGTFIILKLMNHDERLFRRASENGVYPLLFADSPADQHWKLVCEAYWDRLLLRNVEPLDQTMRMRLFELSAGMPWALKLLLQDGQKSALLDGRETLAAKALMQVYREKLVTFHPLLEAMRTGNAAALAKYENMYSPVFDRRNQRKASKEMAALQHTLGFATSPLQAA